MSDVKTLNRKQLSSFASDHESIKFFESISRFQQDFTGNKGDITVEPNGQWVINPSAVDNAKLAPVAGNTFKGRNDVLAGTVEDLTTQEATAMLDVFTASLNGVVPSSGGVPDTYIASDATWKVLPSDRISNGDKGGITVSNNGLTWELNDESVGNDKLSLMASNTIKGNNTGIIGSPVDLSASNVTQMLDLFTGSSKGLVPPSGGIIGNYLDASGSWLSLSASSIPDGDKGDITTSGSGSIWTLDDATVSTGKIIDGAVTGAKILNNTVTNSKLDNMPPLTIKGNSDSVNTLTPQDLTSSQATSILDLFTSTTKGLVPASGGGPGNYIDATGVWRQGFINIIKTTNETRNNTAVLAADSVLQVTLPVGRFIVNGLFYFNQANNGMDFKYDVNFSGTGVYDYTYREHVQAGANAGSNNFNTFFSNVAIPSTFVNGSAGIGFAGFKLSIDISVSGILAFRWAQNNADPANLTGLTGSYIQYMRV